MCIKKKKNGSRTQPSLPQRIQVRRDQTWTGDQRQMVAKWITDCRSTITATPVSPDQVDTVERNRTKKEGKTRAQYASGRFSEKRKKEGERTSEREIIIEPFSASFLLNCWTARFGDQDTPTVLGIKHSSAHRCCWSQVCRHVLAQGRWSSALHPKFKD